MSKITHEYTMEIKPDNFMKVTDDGTKIYEDKNLEITIGQLDCITSMKIINVTCEEDINAFLDSAASFVEQNVNTLHQVMTFMQMFTNAILSHNKNVYIHAVLSSQLRSILSNEFNEGSLHKLFKTLILNTYFNSTYSNKERNILKGFFMLFGFMQCEDSSTFDKLENIIIRREMKYLHRLIQQLESTRDMKELKTGMDVTEKSKNNDRKRLNRRLNKVINTLDDLVDTLCNQNDDYFDHSCLHDLITLCKGLKKDPNAQENELVKQCFLRNK